MRLLLNLLWAVLGGGIIIFIQYLLGGLLLCLTIVGIPFGLQCFKIAVLGLLPFGREPFSNPSGIIGGTLGLIFNIVWVIFAGLWICLTHLGLAIGLAVTIIGIPFAFQHLKLAFLALAPFGQDVREVR
jgi:uncharacterized membrane protein YccF (DUF307 family)